MNYIGEVNKMAKNAELRASERRRVALRGTVNRRMETLLYSIAVWETISERHKDLIYADQGW